jgi:hypothetical protein
MKFQYILATLVLLFVISYDPKSGTINKILTETVKQPACCDDVNYMADNMEQCKHAHYEGISMARSTYGCPTGNADVHLGAIIER